MLAVTYLYQSWYSYTYSIIGTNHSITVISTDFTNLSLLAMFQTSGIRNQPAWHFQNPSQVNMAIPQKPNPINCLLYTMILYSSESIIAGQKILKIPGKKKHAESNKSIFS